MRSPSLSSVFPRLLLPAIWSFLLLAAGRSPCEAAQRTFLLASDGYGIDDCLATKSACGKMVADAWCSAHGLAKAVAFGSADDLTASIGAKEPSPAGSAVVTCSD
jgi:hypothetical protein